MCNQGLKQFTINTINDYNKSIRVIKYVNNIPSPENIEHPNYDQIGVRYRLEEAIFDPNSDVYPGVIGLTDVITLGEQAYFVRKLINDNEIISRYEIDRKKFTPDYFQGLIGDWDAAAIFPVDIFYEDLHMIKQKKNKWLRQISYPDRDAIFNRVYPLYPVSQKLINEINHKIIIYHKRYTKWHFVEFANDYFDKPQRLKVEIADPEEGHRITLLKTVNRLEYDPPHVKIITITE